MEELFKYDYKQYTPFSIVTVRHEKINSTFRLVKNGDILLNLYLMYDDVIPEGFSWSNYIINIELYIGEQKILEYPIEFITRYHKYCMADTYSKSLYSDSSYFLPIHIPQIPVCALRFHELKILVKTKLDLQNIDCYSTVGFLSEDDRSYLMNETQDILIHQIQKKQIGIDGTVQLSHPVKFMFSDEFDIDRLFLDGKEVTIPYTQYYYMYKYIDYDSKISIDSILTDLNGLSSCTSTTVGYLSFIFLTQGSFYILFDSKNFTFTRVSFSNEKSITYSTFDGNKVLACGEKHFISINPNNPTSIIEQNINVDKPFAIVDPIIIGELSYYDTSTNQRVFYNSTSPIVYFAYADRINSTSIRLISTNGQLQSTLILGTPVESTSLYDSPGITNYPNTSGVLNKYGKTYYSPLRATDPFFVESSGSIIYSSVVGLPTTSLVFNEREYIYLIPNGDLTRFIRVNFAFSSIFSFFLGFCLEMSTNYPCGSINFSRVHEVYFPKVRNKSLYAINYNILRIQNGMGNILYAS